MSRLSLPATRALVVGAFVAGCTCLDPTLLTCSEQLICPTGYCCGSDGLCAPADASTCKVSPDGSDAGPGSMDAGLSEDAGPEEGGDAGPSLFDAGEGDAGLDGGEPASDAGPGPFDAGGGGMDGGPDAGPSPTDAGPGDAGCTGNYHQCGSTCLYNGDPLSCGERCTACPTVENGTATCDGTTCGFTCETDAGYHACGTACVLEDGNSCGPTCLQCQAPPFATPICVSERDGGAACGASCDGTLQTCSNGTCGNALGGECGVDAGPCCVGSCGTNGLCCAAPANGTACTSTQDCQSNACPGVNTSGFQCGSAGLCCQGTGAGCSSDAECCSNSCLGSFCNL